MPEPLTDEQRIGLERAVGSAIALADWLVSRYKLNRKNIAGHITLAKSQLEKNDEASSN